MLTQTRYSEGFQTGSTDPRTVANPALPHRQNRVTSPALSARPRLSRAEPGHSAATDPIPFTDDPERVSTTKRRVLRLRRIQ
jgi:hypothetical protein